MEIDKYDVQIMTQRVQENIYTAILCDQYIGQCTSGHFSSVSRVQENGLPN
jgi:hypothetical protein